MRDVLDRKPSKTGSFVILCHDTTAKDANEVASDIKDIEDAAKKYDTKVVYHTMSSLYQTIVKSTP
jgi:hypothetical protein